MRLSCSPLSPPQPQTHAQLLKADVIEMTTIHAMLPSGSPKICAVGARCPTLAAGRNIQTFCAGILLSDSRPATTWSPATSQSGRQFTCLAWELRQLAPSPGPPRPCIHLQPRTTSHASGGSCQSRTLCPQGHSHAPQGPPEPDPTPFLLPAPTTRISLCKAF